MVRRLIIIFVLPIVLALGLGYAVRAQEQDGRLISLYDRGVTTVFITKETTLKAALKAQDITLDARDTVEPSLDQELVAKSYHVNIYRARPVVVVDGMTRIKTTSARQTAQQIASDVGVVIYDEDITSLRPSTNIIRDGASLELTIMRAVPLTLDLYGKKIQIRTQAKTVEAMLREKGILLGKNSRVSLAVTASITAGMEVRVWREGVQTVSVDQEIPVSTEIIYDGDRPIGYRAVQTKGAPGTRSITYQVEVKDGVEVSRVEIANIVTKNPTKQTEVIGLRNDGGGLTQGKGAQQFTDSKGVTHRETYYDLDMSRVMQSCGQGGYYTVRPDGAKVDAQGYILIAANYAIYPKCSLVETSLGTGKVYDTGGFVSHHPYGFDLATDWSAADGR